MGKVKDVKKSSKPAEVTNLSKVKHGSITKSSQTPISKSKQVAKEVAAKSQTTNGKKSKRAATPSSDESESGSSSESESSDGSESEAEVKKPIAATNGKTNGKANGNGVKKAAASDDSESDSASDASDSGSDDSEDDEEAAPVKAVKKVVDNVKASVNGAAKAVVKATAASDDESDSGSSDSSESSDEETEVKAKQNGSKAEPESADESDSADSDDSDSASDEEVPSKKRKADAEPELATKKAKNEVADTGSKNLFVGNLSWNIDDEWLYREFEEFGEITGARVISDRDSGRSKGFGYVEFANSADAAKALNAKKGALIDGREANVDFSTPRDNNAAPRDRANSRAQQYGDSKNPESDTLFVGNISFEANEDMIGEAFGAHGSVINVRLPTDMDSGNPKGFGYVTFASVEDAKSAYENMMGVDIGGRPVRLDFATPRPERGGDSGRVGGRGRGRGGFGDRGGRSGGRGGFGDRGGRGGGRGGRGGSTNRGGFGDFKGQKKTF